MASGNRNHLAVVGPGGVHYGYGRMHISFRDALEKQVTLSPTASTVVYMMQPMMVRGWYEGQHRVLFTMWETDKLPYTIAELLPQFDTVVVPCEHNRKVFAEHHDNVVVVPLGIDTDLWSPRKPRKRKGPFRFLAGGSHWRRKGLDVVLEAFAQIEGDVELHLKCKPDIIGGVPEIKDSRVTVHLSVISEEEERDFYCDMDCFIAVSRGEGWGMMPLQAIAAGIPTILSDTSGHQMFKHLAYSVVDTTPVPCDEERLYNIGNWDEPNVATLVEQMRKVMVDKPVVKTAEAAKYTWDHAATELLKYAKPRPILKNPLWALSDEATIKVKALKKIEADIGRHRIRMVKDEIQLIPINAKTVLLEAGAIILV